MRATQRTLRRATPWLTGAMLDRPGAAALRIHPAPPDLGVVFVRADLPGAPQVRCRPENLRAQPRWSALEEDGVVVHHTEHVLGALGGMGLDNAIIELSNDRVPVLSAGSCATLCAALAAAGSAPCPVPRRQLLLTRSLCIEEVLPPPPGVTAPPSRCTLLAVPDEIFSVTFVFHVPAMPALRAGIGEYRAGDDFAATLGAARSFDLCAALGRGVAQARDLLLLDEATSQQELAEIARHKALDLLGDLRVLGGLPRGRFLAVRSGHRQNQRLVQTLAAGDYLATG